MRLRSAVGGGRIQGCWRRRWWLGAVLAACLLGAGAAQAQPFVYVSNSDNTVSQYDAMAGALSPLAPATVAAGGAGTAIGVAVSLDGKSVYVANGHDGTVSQYDVGTTGALTPKTPATVFAGIGPSAVAVSPDGKSVYVTSSDDTAVLQYDVGVGGALTLATTGTSGSLSFGIVVRPDGKSVYVANNLDVSQFDVGAGGALTPKTPASVAAGAFPFGVAVSPDGKSVYVTNSCGGN
jgi:DNA-binding beta-propeller fold protein YncE